MDPFHPLRQWQDSSKGGAIVEAIEDYVGIGSVLFQEFEIVSGVHCDGLGEPVQEAEERIVRARNDK